jgi:hypothetical protein
VVSGAVPDAETLGKLEEARRAHEKALKRKSEKERVEKALPNVCRCHEGFVQALLRPC